MTEVSTLREALVVALSSTIRGRRAELRLTEPGSGGAHFDIDIVPMSDHSAPVWITVAAPDIDMVLGLGSRMRVTIGSGLSQDEAVQRVAEVCAAVADGRLEETVWRRGERVTGAKGILRVGSTELRMSSNAPVVPFRSGEAHHYERYPEGEVGG